MRCPRTGSLAPSSAELGPSQQSTDARSGAPRIDREPHNHPRLRLARRLVSAFCIGRSMQCQMALNRSQVCDDVMGPFMR